MNNSLLKQLRVPFATVTLKSSRGKSLRIESDGRAGNGFTHWRAVKVGRQIVADLSDAAGHFNITIAKRGSLRDSNERHEFRSMAAAVKFLIAVF